MSHKHALSSGPFQLPRFLSFRTPGGQSNRLVISLNNPTDHELEAVVRLDVCLNPTTPTSGTFPLNPGEIIVGTTTETEYNFGLVKVQPHSSERIERFIDATELRGTFRVTAIGNFDVYAGEPVGGKLEISVVAGEQVSSTTFGLLQADVNTSIHYESWVAVCL